MVSEKNSSTTDMHDMQKSLGVMLILPSGDSMRGHHTEAQCAVAHTSMHAQTVRVCAHQKHTYVR